MTMTKRAPRGAHSSWDTDVSASLYIDALPGTPEEVAVKIGVSFRRAERSLGILRRLKLVERKEGVFSATEAGAAMQNAG